MKKIAALIVLALVFTTAFAQKNLKNRFEKDLINYTTAFNNKEWNTVTDMMYPRIFEKMSKDNMIMLMEGMDNMGVKMTTDFKYIDRISEVVESGNEKYCKIHYYGVVKVKLSGLMSQGSGLVQPKFEQEFGKENVKYNEESNSFTIQARRSMLAVANKNSSNWKYIDINSPQAKGLQTLIPEHVKRKLQ
ncbi:hypothetical protein [Marinifilum caeruleilacunae]|uniref:DUF4468 domain-containing protein n=1 Tax=Marinifilum caeruleilacunae TaxID=2499076 RepID=A0ABX1WZ82_9BACT|nr:hypothetical protein [Marinifilum caeruleilacunae]NOU61470.1 hypothetical protein [Marinifilum caeruleilacunae]